MPVGQVGQTLQPKYLSYLAILLQKLFFLGIELLKSLLQSICIQRRCYYLTVKIETEKL